MTFNTPILIVDHDIDIRKVTTMMLMQLGYTTINEAKSGQEALSIVRTSNIGLVISAWNMVPMSGIQLLQEIRANANLINLPFLIMITKATNETIIELKEAGANDYIIKPFDMGCLKAKIENILGASNQDWRETPLVGVDETDTATRRH